RTDIRRQDVNASYYFRPEGKFLISWGPTLQQFDIWDHRGTALDYFVFPGFRIDMARATFIHFHPYAYDNVYLRPQDYSGLTTVTNHILRSKWNWQFTRELSARMIFQYAAVLSDPLISSLSPTKNFNADFLITYFVRPGTAVYVGYNGNLQNLDRRLIPAPTGLLTTRDSFINDGRQFFVKLSYLFRL